MRPAEVDVLRGNFSKAKEKLNWSPKTSFVDLVKKMVDNDIKLLRNG
jgi:GDPmannose 4,6-dehydratase